MRRKSKFISGLETSTVLKRSVMLRFSELERHQIIEDYLSSGSTKRDVWKKYTGRDEEHGTILRWMRELGYNTYGKRKTLKFASNKKEKMSEEPQTTEEKLDEFEILQLKKRISDLEQQLKDAQMKSIAFSTMVDIAEREFNISIRKKYNTKPSKQ